MKRALAERAKQNDAQNRGVNHAKRLTTPTTANTPHVVVSMPVSVSSHTSAEVPPQKVQKTNEGSVTGTFRSSSSSHAPRAPPQSNPPPAAPTLTLTNLSPRPKPTNPKKRSRPSPMPTEEQESNAFYLKHQNRALSSELHALQHWVQVLEKERLVRRRECRAIAEALGGLEGSWVEMEVVLRRGLEGIKGEMEMVRFLFQCFGSLFNYKISFHCFILWLFLCFGLVLDIVF